MDKREQIMKLRRQKPFVPFQVNLSDGQSIVLTEPFMFGVNDIIMLVAKKPAGSAQIPLADIVSIDVLEPIA